MKEFFVENWQRFKSDIPDAERKAQIILGLSAGSFTSVAAINWPGKMAIIGTIAGYIAAACAGMAFMLQWFEKTQIVLETKKEITITSKETTTATELPADNSVS